MSELAEKLNVLAGGNVNVGKSETTVPVCTNSNFSNQRFGGLVDQEIARQELKELEEQRRRSDCIILRGCGTNDVNAVKAMFNCICGALSIEIIQMSDMTQINNSGMFRARVADDDQRHLLLGATKKLKFIDEFKSVFVQKDLTLNQEEI